MSDHKIDIAALERDDLSPQEALLLCDLLLQDDDACNQAVLLLCDPPEQKNITPIYSPSVKKEGIIHRIAKVSVAACLALTLLYSGALGDMATAFNSLSPQLSKAASQATSWLSDSSDDLQKNWFDHINAPSKESDMNRGISHEKE